MGAPSIRRTDDRPLPLDRDPELVEMYRAHPSPGHRAKLEFADRRMELRLACCGIEPGDWTGARVLDAGCGTGEYACWFAARGADVVGLDLSEESLAQARRFADGHSIGGVQFRVGSVLDLPFDPASFDLVYCTGVLHHTPDPSGGFRELARVLRPGGKLLVSLYHSWGFLPRQLRWRVARRLGGGDLDRRVDWGRRLFPLTARRLTDDRLEDPESPLYDYFAAPRQSTHGLREVLGWLDRTGLEFRGAFPPARPADYPALFRHPGYDKMEDELRSPLHRLLARFGESGLSRERPGREEQFLTEFLWLLAGVDIFSVGGSRPASDHGSAHGDGGPF